MSLFSPGAPAYNDDDSDDDDDDDNECHSGGNYHDQHRFCTTDLSVSRSAVYKLYFADCAADITLCFK